jgi:CheY-like chemotaxis protein
MHNVLTTASRSRTIRATANRTLAMAPSWNAPPTPGKMDPDGQSQEQGRNPQPTPRTSVLIIEDQRMHALALRSLFTRKGCDVVGVADTVKDGIAMLASRPDYIVLDLTLADGDGVEILKRVRASEREMPSPRVIVTTAVRDADRLREVLALRPHRLLEKPTDLVDLLRAIGMM